MNYIRINKFIVYPPFQEIRQELISHRDNVNQLVKDSKRVPSLKKRYESIKDTKTVISVCDYSPEQVDIIFGFC